MVKGAVDVCVSASASATAPPTSTTPPMVSEIASTLRRCLRSASVIPDSCTTTVRTSDGGGVEVDGRRVLAALRLGLGFRLGALGVHHALLFFERGDALLDLRLVGIVRLQAQEAAQRLGGVVRALQPLQRRGDVVEQRRLVRELERLLELVVGELVVAGFVGGAADLEGVARGFVLARVGARDGAPEEEGDRRHSRMAVQLYYARPEKSCYVRRKSLMLTMPSASGTGRPESSVARWTTVASGKPAR